MGGGTRAGEEPVVTPPEMAALVASGFVAGVVNIVAGGGSFLTLPVLLWAGLAPAAANGTNRIAVVLQNVAGAAAFARRGLVPGAWVLWAAVPAMVTAPLGVWLALQIPPDAFKRLLATLMAAIAFAAFLYSPKLDSLDVPSAPKKHLVWSFALIGVYTGFLQAGVGFMMLAILQWRKLNLVHGNAVKICSILGATVVSLVMFASLGHVEWAPGLLLAAGTIAGGHAGVRVVAAAGHRRLRAAVMAAMLAFAALLWAG